MTLATIAWNADVDATVRFDSEHYKPELAHNLKRMQQVGGGELGRLLDPKLGITGGSTPLGANYQTDGVRFIRTQNYGLNGIALEQCVFISDDHDRANTRSRLNAGDVLLSITGVYFGASAVVTPACLPANISQHSVRIRFAEDAVIDPYYLATFFNSPSGHLETLRQSVGFTRPALDYGAIRDIFVPQPSKQVQDAIGHKVRAAERLRATAETAKQAIRSSFPGFVLQTRPLSGQWLSDEVVDTERLEAQYYQPHFLEMMKVIDAIPGKIVTLNKLVSSMRHGASVTGADAIGGRVRFIRGTEISPNRISTDDVVLLDDAAITELASSHFVKSGDLLVTRSGTVGMCAVAREREIGVAFGSFVIAVQIESDEGVSPEYVAAFLNSPLGQGQFRREENGAVQMNINNGELARIRVPLFTSDFRERIVKYVETFNSNLDRSEVLVKSAIADVGSLIEGKLEEDECLAQGRKLAEEFGLEVP
jgi:type I restriction enzyme S subunit